MSSAHPPPSPSSLQHQEISSAGSSPPVYGSNQFGDNTLTKIFVGGLAWETSRDSLGRYFERFGEILEAVVIIDKSTGRSKGYGFVTFRDPECARKACADPVPVIDGRRANCNLASLGVRSRPGTPQGGKYGGGSPTLGRSPSRAQPFSGTSSPQHLPFPHQQGYPYPPYGCPPYQQEYLYSHNMVYNAPYMMTTPYAPHLFGSVGAGPPPPNVGSLPGGPMYPGYGPYTYQQAPFPYPPFGAGHMPPHNQPSPTGLLPDQSALAAGGPRGGFQYGGHSHQA